MEFRQLRYVQTVAQERNFTRAAERLHIAQPSLSQQIGKLEQELGVLLFDRTPQVVRLTDAGERFIEKASMILDTMEELQLEMQDISGMKKGRLIIGTLPITGAHLLPQVLARFRSLFPGIELILAEETSSNLATMTAQGECDLSLLSLPMTNPQLDWVPIYNETILLAVPPDHELVATGLTDWRQLRYQPFILLKKGQGFRDIVEALCKHNGGFTPQVAFESTNIDTVQSLVAVGMGVSLVPQMVTRTGDIHSTPTYLSFPSPEPTRTLVCAYRKGRYLSKAAQAFLSFMENLHS